MVLMTLQNTTAAATVRRPALSIHSVAPLQFSARDGAVTAGKETRIAAPGRVEVGEAQVEYRLYAAAGAGDARPGRSQAGGVHHRPPLRQARRGPDARRGRPAARDAARRWWETVDLPFQTVQVPDAGVQAVIESSVRNIWQAREILRGKPAYHIGPTSYRSLAMVDDTFIYETLCMSAQRDARDGVEYFLGHQEADGSFQLIYRYNGVKGFWKENGIMLWAACRHAQLLQDKAWLRARWPALRKVVEVIQRLRRETLADPASLGYGLLPGGYIDGGLDNKPPGSKPEYSNVCWSLTGLRAALAAAQWLGDAGAPPHGKRNMTISTRRSARPPPAIR